MRGSALVKHSGLITPRSRFDSWPTQSRGGEVASRLAHIQKIAGSSPACAMRGSVVSTTRTDLVSDGSFPSLAVLQGGLMV